MYFERALERYADLRFDLQHIFEGVDGCVLVYLKNGGKLSAEYLEFDEEGLIVCSRAHYLGR